LVFPHLVSTESSVMDYQIISGYIIRVKESSSLTIAIM
jgi:hypothetical protein